MNFIICLVLMNYGVTARPGSWSDVGLDIFVESNSMNNQVNDREPTGPLWPQPRNIDEQILLLPKKITSGDQITIAGTFKNSNEPLKISLLNARYGTDSPDYDRATYELVFDFPTNKFNLNIHGVPQQFVIPVTLQEMLSGPDFQIALQFNQQKLVTMIGESPIHVFNDLQYHLLDSTKYIVIAGNAKNISLLRFTYGLDDFS